MTPQQAVEYAQRSESPLREAREYYRTFFADKTGRELMEYARRLAGALQNTMRMWEQSGESPAGPKFKVYLWAVGEMMALGEEQEKRMGVPEVEQQSMPGMHEAGVDVPWKM